MNCNGIIYILDCAHSTHSSQYDFLTVLKEACYAHQGCIDQSTLKTVILRNIRTI